MRPDLHGPLRLAGVYSLFSSLWIFGSDSLLQAMVQDGELAADLQTAKGMLFILLSTLLIFVVSYRDRRAQRLLVEELTHSTSLLQQTQRHAGLGSWEYSTCFIWTAEALALLGHDTDEELDNRQCSLERLLSWLHPADRPAAQRALQALLHERKPMTLSARLYQPHKLQATWLLLHGEVNEQDRIIGTVQDISSQKRDESALRESEQRFRQLFEQTPRIAVQGYDRERRVIYWNQASTQLYGYSLQEAIGKRLEDLIIPPTSRTQVAAAIQSWLLGGPAIPAAELRLQRKDGSQVWVYSSHSILRNSRDQLEMYCIDIDLSEQKQVYGELLASEERFRELVEQLSDVIFLADAHGHLTFYNPAWEKLSGYLSDESLGRPLTQFLDDEDGQKLAKQISALARGEETSLRSEYRLLTRNGKIRRIELQLSRSQPDNSLRGCLRDIHERFQTQELQNARNAVLDELLARRPLPHILDNISRRLQGLNPHMLVSIMLLDPQQRLHLGAAPSLPESYCKAIDGLQAAPEVGSCGHAACNGELVIAEDLNQHPFWRDFRELTNAAGLRACWSLPFKDDSNRVLGTFGIYYHHCASPSNEDIALVTEFTRLAGLAVQQQCNY